ncbi:MAG: site-2 protease family protein [Candidatus Niyogibacteria bacterium]|nr:site-2 protease family protein [Candidatus Niyogibacteria bacterium]
MQELDFFFSLAVLVMSVVIHEVAHGAMANRLGDPTARYLGRLTLNPAKHIDPVGSVIVPIASYLLGGVIFGWAKPVPYNPYNLRDQKWGPALVAAAGPLSNLSLAVLFAMIIRYGVALGLSAAFFQMASVIVIVNLVLAIFNLVPIPPLDGSKILYAVLPRDLYWLEEYLEQHGWIILLVFIFFFWSALSPIVYYLFRALIGI